jgi:prepilin-type N-terminal cleavage/methylation domain-containing protein
VIYKSDNRRAFTLIELVVAIAIIGILAGLILPAISSAREASRKLTCNSNMRQIGLGLFAHMAAHRRFPAGAMAKEYVGSPQTPWNFYRWSALAMITPHLDGTNVYRKLDLSKPLYQITLNVDPAHSNAVKLIVPIFFCPSDKLRIPNRDFGPTNYAVCAGSGSGGGTPFDTDGMFHINSETIDTSASDGMANTALASESLIGVSSNRDRDVKSSYRFTFTTPLTESACNSANRWNYTEARGFSWANGEYRTTMYNHYEVPNTPQYDCMSAVLNGNPDTRFAAYGWRAARSNHDNCVNLLLGDGAVVSVQNNIDPAIWKAYATRNNREEVFERIR